MTLRRDAQLVALCVLLALAAGVPIAWGYLRRPPPEVDTRLDLNRATQAELEFLPRIGRKRAEAIVQFRAQRGSFHSVEDLREVPGLDEKTVEEIRPRLKVEKEGSWLNEQGSRKTQASRGRSAGRL